MNHPTEDLSWTRRLGAGLTALAEAPAPPATVTVADVIEAGRREIRRRRNRTVFALSAALITATALSLGALTLANHGGGGTATPADSPSAVATPSIGSGSDPAAPIVAFGWLPTSLNGEYEAEQYATGPNYHEAIDPTSGMPPENGPGNAGVQVWAPGDVILSASVSMPGSGVDPGVKFSFPAGTVQGHQAWWTLGDPGSKKAAATGNLVLIWQYAPDAWAMVDYHGDTGAASGAMVMKVANSLVIGPTNPAALPFRMTRLPAGIHPDAVIVDLPKQHGAQVGAVALRMCVTSPCAPGGEGLVVSQRSTTWMNNATFTVDDTRGGTGGSTTTVSIDGHPATLSAGDRSATLTFDYDKSAVSIAAAGAEYRELGGKNGFLAFCRSLTFLGSNPADWTTDVITG